ncbi:MAG TPA: DMT family transporter [Jiangellaceae bacterium]|nr:DMT family transporter [Jiangellaceae bacterium]
MDATNEASSRQSRADLTWLVALAAAMWGTSALMREPLLGMGVPSAMIVLAEHVVLVVCVLPWLRPAVRGFVAASVRTKLAVIVIGAGSSALATTMFTAAFAVGDPITPQVLQKLQPAFAILLAAVILGERLRPRFWMFAVPAVAGSWFLAFDHPFAVTLDSALAAVLAIGSALLWAAGTVLGRYVGAELAAVEVTALRFVFGLIAMVAIVGVRGDWSGIPVQGLPLVVVLALVPGLLSLSLYYRGLRRTPASRATLAELAFPLTAAAVGLLLGQTLVWSQWLGFGVVLVSVTMLVLHERSRPTPAVAASDHVQDALRAG